jgi:HD superfamily phosphohydrolase
LRKLNASLEEQIAGLLHDASHTAFSHVVDFLYKTHNENYGDDILEKILQKTDVPKTLRKHKINFKFVIDESNFSLLENNAPDICADRLDYTLREVYQRRSKKDAKFCYFNLIVKNNEIIFGNKKSADLFTKYYFDLQKEHWGSIENMLRYELTANVLKYAANKKIISLNDLHKDDQYVLNKLIVSKDKFIEQELSKVFKIIEFEIDETNFEFNLRKKYRFVDPKFYDSKTKKVKRYSKENIKYLKELINHKKIHEKGYRVRLLKKG